MNLKPLGDRVIVKADEAEETTASGLFIASEAKEKPQSGVVLAVGAGKPDKDGNLVPVPVKRGPAHPPCRRSVRRLRISFDRFTL